MTGAILAELPALPLHTAGKYVAGAYIVLFALVLIYVAISAIRLSRMERDLGELLALEQSTRADAAPAGASGPERPGAEPAHAHATHPEAGLATGGPREPAHEVRRKSARA